MKHPLIILGTIGGVLILGGLAWVYFFLYYEPVPENVRVAENPFVEVEAGSFDPSAGEERGVGDDTEAALPSAVTAVTDRKVAGAVGMDGGIYRFVEAGTGHVYEVANGGAEQKISNTTYPQAHDAWWSPSGASVAIAYNLDGTMRTEVVRIDSPQVTEATTTPESGIAGAIHSVAWSPDGLVLRFVRETERGSTGVSYDTDKRTEKVLFQTPLREITVVWDPSPLIVTRASRTLTGYAYRTDLTSVADGMPGLTAAVVGDITLFSGLSSSNLTSWLVRNDVTTALDTPVIPEKCAASGADIVCAFPKRFDPSRYPDEWYRGEEIHDDTIIAINTDTGVSRQLGDLSVPFRAPLDIIRTEPAREGALMLSRDRRLVHVQ